MNAPCKTLAILALAIGSTAASFGGLLGENYAGAGLGYTRLSSSGGTDGWRAEANLNHNIVRNTNYGIDFNASYAYGRIKGSSGYCSDCVSSDDNYQPTGLSTDLTLLNPVYEAYGVMEQTEINAPYSQKFRTNEALIGVTAFSEMGNLRPFVGVFTGWVWASHRESFSREKYDSWVYGLRGGVEFTLTDELSLAPSIELQGTDDDRLGDWTWVFALDAHYWLSESWGVGVGYSVTDGPQKQHTGMAMATFRY